MSWPVGTVSELAEVISGYAFKSTWFGEGSSKVIRIGDLKNGRIDVENAACFDEEANSVKEQFKIREGDILMALSGATVGKIAVATVDTVGCYLNQRVAIVRSKSPESADYLKYVFSGSYLDKLLLSAGGAAQPNLSPKDLSNMEIPLPPLDEQKRIAAILDKADAIRRKRQQAIDLADDFLRSAFIERFGDPRNSTFPIKELQEVCTKITDGTHHTPTYTDSGVHFLRVTDINKAKVNWNNTKFVSKEEHLDLIKRCHPEKGDVLYSKNGTIGVPRLIDWDTEFSIFVSLCLIKPKKELLLGGYLESFLKTPFALKQATARAKSATVTNLHLVEIKEIKLPTPPLDVQRDWLDFVSNHKDMMTKLEHSMNEANNQFNSISQQAFSGEL